MRSSLLWVCCGLLVKGASTHRLVQRCLLVSLGIVCIPSIATATTPTPVKLAQAAPNPEGDPNRFRIPQPLPIPAPVPPTQPPLDVQPPTPTPPPGPASARIAVKKIEVTGSTIFGPAELNPITRSVEGHVVTLEELAGVADKITQLYLDRGFITSRAILVDQTITDGVVQIRVVEGRLERIEVQGTRRLKRSYIQSRVQLGAGTPLSTSKLEDQLRLLRADPLLESVEASLRAGSGVGQSILVVRVTEAKPFAANLSFDNFSPPSIGSERYGVQLGDLNLTGLGDELTAAYYGTTTRGADVFDFSYRVPLNPMNGTLQFRAAPNRNKITQAPFDRFDIRGTSDLYELSYRQPLVRSLRQEFALSLGFAYQDGQTFTFAGPTPFGFGPDSNGNSNTRVIKFGQDYVSRDLHGVWSLQSLLSFGINVFGATINPKPIPDGRFFSFLGQVQRAQQVNKNNLFIAQTDFQLTPDGLLPSQEFVIGGGQSLRGYRQNVRAGDNGLRLSLEDRVALQHNITGESTFQLAPFFDLGTVWNVNGNPNQLQRQRFLAGLGLGLLWEPVPSLNIRLDYGAPLVGLRDKGTNLQDNGFYFSVNYRPF